MALRESDLASFLFNRGSQQLNDFAIVKYVRVTA